MKMIIFIVEKSRQLKYPTLETIQTFLALLRQR